MDDKINDEIEERKKIARKHCLMARSELKFNHPNCAKVIQHLGF